MPPKQPKPPEHVEVFYDRRDGSYWYKVTGQYECLKKSDLYLHLRSEHGLADDIYIEGVRELDWPLLNAQRTRKLDYAGSLAGHRVGLFSDGGGRRYLVTDEARGIWDDVKKRPGTPEFFLRFIQELLPDDQWLYFCHWLAVALRSLRRGDFAPGQIIFFVGEARCGKSLLQYVITEILGGRVANPYKFLVGDTTFNKDLCGSEHWMMEDPGSTTDPRSRREFGDAIKNCVATLNFYIEQKNKDGLLLQIFRRVTCSINNESENVARIPPMDPSMIDKAFVFQCAKVEKAFAPFREVEGTPALPNMPKETQNDGELSRAKVWAAFMEEIPQIRAWILAKFKTIPAELRDDRYGIKAWQHPEIMAELSALAPETRLLQLIDQVMFSDGDKDSVMTKWEGKAMDLEAKLRESKFSYETEKILRYSGACGAYLGKLSRNHAQRVSVRKLDGYSHWTINPPSATNGEK